MKNKKSEGINYYPITQLFGILYTYHKTVPNFSKAKKPYD